MGFVTNWREAFLGLKGVAEGQTVQLFSRAQLFVTPWTSAHRVSLSITSSWSLLKLMSIESWTPVNPMPRINVHSSRACGVLGGWPRRSCREACLLQDVLVKQVEWN